MSAVKFPSGTRLSEKETNATKRPSRLIAGSVPPALAWVPSLATLTRVVTPVRRSRTNTSAVPLLSPWTRLDDSDENATKRPSPLMLGPPMRSRTPLAPSPCLPLEETLTRSVVPSNRSRTNTSAVRLVSLGTRFSENDENATKRPSALTDGNSLSWSPCTPALLALTSSVTPGACWAEDASANARVPMVANTERRIVCMGFSLGSVAPHAAGTDISERPVPQRSCAARRGRKHYPCSFRGKGGQTASFTHSRQRVAEPAPHRAGIPRSVNSRSCFSPPLS